MIIEIDLREDSLHFKVLDLNKTQTTGRLEIISISFNEFGREQYPKNMPYLGVRRVPSEAGYYDVPQGFLIRQPEQPKRFKHHQELLLKVELAKPIVR